MDLLLDITKIVTAEKWARLPERTQREMLRGMERIARHDRWAAFCQLKGDPADPHSLRAALSGANVILDQTKAAPSLPGTVTVTFHGVELTEHGSEFPSAGMLAQMILLNKAVGEACDGVS